MDVWARLGVLLLLICGFAAEAEPLTTCPDAKGWTLEAGATIPALGRVLRASETPRGFELEVSDGRQWSLSQHDGAVQVTSGAVEALTCQGALVREPLMALAKASKALPPRRAVGVCRRVLPDGKRFAASVVVGPVLGGGAVEVQLVPDEERQWTLVLTSLEPLLGTAARCFSAAGRHCDATAVPQFDWRGRVTVHLKDDGEAVRLSCNLDRESLARPLR